MKNDTRTALAWGTGMIVGVLWLAMAFTCLVSAGRAYANARNDWGLAWGLIGSLLLIAGLGAIVGTWWHQRHVLRDSH